MKTKKQKLFCLLLETVGIAALFLPFTSGQSPWEELGGIWHARLGWYFHLAMPGFLAPIVCLQTLRSLLPQPLTRPELRLCAGLVGLLALVPLGLGVVRSDWHTEWKWIILLGLFYGLAAIAPAWLLWLKRHGVAGQILAPLAMRGAYIPNAVYCLLGFSEWGSNWAQLEVGAMCVAATVILYLVEIGALTRQGLKSRPAPALCRSG